jgi:hypothetical protein
MDRAELERVARLLLNPELQRLVAEGFQAQREWIIRMGYVQATASLMGAGKSMDEAIEMVGNIVTRVCAEFPDEVASQAAPVPRPDDPTEN